eukprot:216755-Chlamydomonas_euryale.AAC.1
MPALPHRILLLPCSLSPPPPARKHPHLGQLVVDVGAPQPKPAVSRRGGRHVHTRRHTRGGDVVEPVHARRHREVLARLRRARGNVWRDVIKCGKGGL